MVPFRSSNSPVRPTVDKQRHKVGALLLLVCCFPRGMENYCTGMVRYMKERFWSTFCWKAFGWRRLKVVDDLSCMKKNNDDLKQQEMSCCWDKMPPELLTEVFMRIEAAVSTWPCRRNVVHCAGVCRSWRENMMEIAKCQLLLSGNLTFPISLKQPGSSLGSLTRCLIDRDSDDQIYYLYLNPNEAPYHAGKFLLAAKRVSYATCTEYIISLDYDDISKGSRSFVGMLRSNFFGTKFRVYDANDAAVTKSHWSMLLGSMKRVLMAGNYAVSSSISYQLNALGNRGPRQMRCEINTSSLAGLNFKLKDVKLVLKDKMSRWQSKLWRWCLNFIGRVTFGSIKEFELVANCLDNNEAAPKELHENNNIILRFEKLVPIGVFTVDYQYPISAFQAFAICLSTFDTKVAS